MYESSWTGAKVTKPLGIELTALDSELTETSTINTVDPFNIREATYWSYLERAQFCRCELFCSRNRSWYTEF